MAATVSVIVPTHDRRDALMTALASVQHQLGDAGLEILVVADRCSDGTHDAVRRAAGNDPRIRLLEVEAGGAAAARNIGLGHATGEYVAFLDDDDVWLPSKVSRQVAAFEHDPAIGLTGCHWVAEYASGHRAVFREPERVDDRDLLWCNFVGGCSPVMVRRSAVPPEELRFDDEMATCEDWDLWARLAVHTVVAIIPEALVRYRAHGEERLSDLLDDEDKGRPAFVRRHHGEMSSVCVAYHELRQQLRETRGWPARSRLGVRALRSLPLGAVWMVLNESVAANAGRWRGDPCLGHRRLHRLIRRA